MLLLNEHRSTSELTRTINEQINSTFDHSIGMAEVRRELISLHHYGCVRIVGVRKGTLDETPWFVEGDPPLGVIPMTNLYFWDLVWTLSRHGRDHGDFIPNCQACQIRERMIAMMGPAADPVHG